MVGGDPLSPRPVQQTALDVRLSVGRLQVTRFSPTPAQIAALVRAQPLAMVVSQGEAGFATTPLPLLATIGAEGEVTEFLGHFSRANPQVQMLQSNPNALVLFQGPHGYISPSAISDRRWAPTWNYAMAQFEVEIRFDAAENAHSIETLVAAMEGEAWSSSSLGERYDRMLGRIIAFRAQVTSSSAKFKLGQDETDRQFAEIVDWLGDSPLAALMLTNRHPA